MIEPIALDDPELEGRASMSLAASLSYSGEFERSLELAKQAVTLLHPRDYNYYELLRSKLNWGRATRDRPIARR